MAVVGLAVGAGFYLAGAAITVLLLLILSRFKHDVLLIADGAEKFADEAKVERVDNKWFDTDEQYERWQARKAAEAKRAAEQPGAQPAASKPQPMPKALQDKKGTVGCVALDKHGNLAAGTSTLSTPVPARAMIRSRGAAWISAAVTLVALRTIRASASARSRMSSSGFRPDRASTVHPGSARRRSRADVGRSSATTILTTGAVDWALSVVVMAVSNVLRARGLRSASRPERSGRSRYSI